MRNDWGDAITWGAAVKDASVHAVCTDAKNTIWGIMYFGKERSRILARWTEEGWTPAKLAYSPDALKYLQTFHIKPISDTGAQELFWMEDLYPGPDGTVCAVNSLSEAPGVQLRGDRARWMPLAHGKGEESDWLLFEDGSGVPWLVWGSPEQFFIEGPKKYDPIMKFGLGAYFGRRMEGAQAVKFVKDSLGRFWYPRDEIPTGRNRDTVLEWALILDPNFDAAKTPLDTLGAGFPPTSIVDRNSHFELLRSPQDRVRDDDVSFTVPKDENTFWLGMMSHTLKEVDVRTLSAKEIRLAPGQHMRGLSRIIQYQGSWYASDHNSLWQEKDGVWTELLKSMDGDNKMAPEFGQERPFLGGELGLWVGAYNGNGAVFVSKDGKLERFDRHRGFSLAQVDFMQRLPNGEILFATKDGSWLSDKERPLVETPPRTPSVEPISLGTLIQDAPGYIWMRGEGFEFKRWESGKWRTFGADPPSGASGNPPTSQITPPPGQVRMAMVPHIASWAFDSSGRLWIVGSPQVRIFTPPPYGSVEEGTWIRYANYHEALAGERPQQPVFLPQYVQGYNAAQLGSMWRIAYAPRGQLAYVDNESVWWSNGSEWRQWSKRKDLHQRDPYVQEYVCFDTLGRLQYQGAKRQLLELSGEWREMDPSSINLTACSCPGAVRSDSKATPPAGSSANPDVCVRDRQGAFWLQYWKKVYRAAYGISLPLYSDDELTPFGQGYWIRHVYTDPLGSGFIAVVVEGGGQGVTYVPISRPQGPPVTRLTGRIENVNTIVLEPSAEPAGTYWYTWRMDDGTWHDATKDVPIRLPNVAGGKHSFEVRAISEHFDISPSPATLSLEVSVSVNNVDQWIAEISSPDYDKRRDAVASLAASAAEALPRLREAREKANADTQWWIDSAIQRCEEALKKATPTAGEKGR